MLHRCLWVLGLPYPVHGEGRGGKDALLLDSGPLAQLAENEEEEAHQRRARHRHVECDQNWRIKKINNFNIFKI